MSDYTSSHVSAVIDEYINYQNCGNKAERNRAILKRRFIDGVCFEPLAEEFEMSVRQVKNIVYKHKSIVFRNL